MRGFLLKEFVLLQLVCFDSISLLCNEEKVVWVDHMTNCIMNHAMVQMLKYFIVVLGLKKKIVETFNFIEWIKGPET
jgi:hypothetical protein